MNKAILEELLISLILRFQENSWIKYRKLNKIDIKYVLSLKYKWFYIIYFNLKS